MIRLTDVPRGTYLDLLPEDVVRDRAALRVIDVREPDEYRGDLGHIPGAELVPLSQVATAATSWAKDSELVIVCRSGGRSARAASMLVNLGFGRVRNMLGGMLRWRDEGRPVER